MMSQYLLYQSHLIRASKYPLHLFFLVFSFSHFQVGLPFLTKVFHLCLSCASLSIRPFSFRSSMQSLSDLQASPLPSTFHLIFSIFIPTDSSLFIIICPYQCFRLLLYTFPDISPSVIHTVSPPVHSTSQACHYFIALVYY